MYTKQYNDPTVVANVASILRLQRIYLAYEEAANNQ